MKYTYYFLFLLMALISYETIVYAQSEELNLKENTEVNLLPPPEIPGYENVEENTVDASQVDNLIESSINQINQSEYKKGEPAYCFDYYKFGSVDINLHKDYQTYEAGDAIVIQGKIKNNNPYPLIGLDIKGRLVKDIPEPVYLRSEIIVLDELHIAENITIPAYGTYDVLYTHLLPLNAPSGEYQMYLYAVEQDRFNMSGLSFTNDIIASYLTFSVSGDTPDHVYLDQTKIQVGEQEHNVMAFMTRHQKDTQVPITIPLYNPETQDKQMIVTYDLYSWDSANPQNKISTKTENVVVPAQSELLLQYVIEKTELPVYYLSITAEPSLKEKDESVHKEKTISNIRLSVQDASKPRLNFVTTNTYPLKKGEEATMVTCFHNTNHGSDANISKIETKLKDSRGKVLAETLYEGNAPSAISAIAQKFIPRRDMTEYVIESTIYDANNTIIDTIEKKYTCSEIDPNLCSKKPMASSILIWITLAGLFVVIVAVIRKRFTNIERV